MTTPSDGDLPDQLLSDPTFQAESPQREIIATLEKFISDTRFDLDELLKLGEQTTADGTTNLPLSAPRADGATSTTVRLFAVSKASSIYKAFLSRLREFDEKFAQFRDGKRWQIEDCKRTLVGDPAIVVGDREVRVTEPKI